MYPGTSKCVCKAVCVCVCVLMKRTAPVVSCLNAVAKTLVLSPPLRSVWSRLTLVRPLTISHSELLYLAPRYISTSHSIESVRCGDNCDNSGSFARADAYTHNFIRLFTYSFIVFPHSSLLYCLLICFSQAVQILGLWPVPPLAPFLLFSSLILSYLGLLLCLFSPVSHSFVLFYLVCVCVCLLQLTHACPLVLWNNPLSFSNKKQTQTFALCVCTCTMRSD